MSYPQDKAPKEKELLKRFYVEFLGWMECRGLRGQRYTEPVIRELRRRQKKAADTPPKLTIKVSKNKLKISQEVDDKRKNRGIKKIEFPSIPGRDVTFVHQATRPGDGRPDDIVACIYLGYMPRTNRHVHVHVYRFDEAATATAFASQMQAIANSNKDRIADVEKKLAIKGQIEPPVVVGKSTDIMSEPQTTDSAVGSASSGYSDDESPTSRSHDIDPDLQSLHEVKHFDNVNDELRYRMKLEEEPLLLPPRDYDTISRKHGNLMNVDQRRCNEEKIVGDLIKKERNGSNESGVDVASPVPEQDEARTRNKIPEAPLPPPATLPKPGAPSEAKTPPETSSKKLVNGHRRQNSLGSGVGLPQADAVYPAKVATPPMSPRLYRQALGNAHRQNSFTSDTPGLDSPTGDVPARHSLPRQHSSSENLGQVLLRQTSGGSENGPRPFHRQNSTNSNGSYRLSQNSSDNERSPDENNIHYYKSPNSEDIYAMPKKPPQSARHSQPPLPPPSPDFPPADYNDEPDTDVNLRVNPRNQFRPPHLTRSMPADLIRSEMVLGSSGSRPGSGEFRQMRRTDSPSFVGGGRTDSPVFLPQRVDSPSFMYGPQGFPMGGHRVDSPSFIAASQPYGLADGVTHSPRLMRINSGKR